MKTKGWKKVDESNAGNALWVHKKTGNEVETMYNPINNVWYMNYRGGRWRDGFTSVQDANDYAVDFMRDHPNG
jgi:hypothetical protein